MRKVVVVEDDKFIAAIFTMFLRELGHELVGRCSTGAEALDLCHRLRPDVVLMDIHLDGELDGIQTSEQLRRELDIPVIYVSSDTSSQVIKRAIVSNSYGYLVKPVNKKELGISIDLAFYKHRVDQEQRERERGYRQFISDAPMPLMILQEGRIQYLNHLALDLFKTHYMEDVITLPYINFVEPEYTELVTALLDDFKNKGIGFQNKLLAMQDVHGQVFYSKISGSAIVFNKKKSLQVTMVEASDMEYSNKTSLAYKTMIDSFGLPYFVTDQHLQIKEISNSLLFNGLELNDQKVDERKDYFEKIEDESTLVYKLIAKDKTPTLFKSHIIKDVSGEVLEIFFYPGK
ncbi:response regulator [Carboxylicivirga linearis]|uniref:Response regulator n=1 Tax=Carboxylicivirga linearis TaxID=1628157 RepID=A0ABS5K1B3_9BACT|nr:response regulator [Carboxylicivirga linearis]MBS2100331.1 response regulator [Carboxylicivirga linearis]